MCVCLCVSLVSLCLSWYVCQTHACTHTVCVCGSLCITPSCSTFTDEFLQTRRHAAARRHHTQKYTDTTCTRCMLQKLSCDRVAPIGTHIHTLLISSKQNLRRVVNIARLARCLCMSMCVCLCLACVHKSRRHVSRMHSVHTRDTQVPFNQSVFVSHHALL